MIKKLILKSKQSIWLYPLLFGLISLILAAIVVVIDMKILFDASAVLPGIFFTRIDLARDILGTIAGSLLTMTTFTFSTTMIVLIMYTSQYSPRTVENFLNDKLTMKILGVFMGGFIYSIVSLLFMRDSLSDRFVVSATIGVIYAIICLVYFSIFINHVGNLIQANNLIERLHNEAKDNIINYKATLEKSKIKSEIELDDYIYGIPIFSKKNGYIQLADKSTLIAISKEIPAVILMKKVIGQFIVDKSELLKIYTKEEIELEDEKIERLVNTITIGNTRNELQDFDFSVQKITEIALRAISPGTNDPNTANHCIRILGELMSMLSDIESGYIEIEDENNGSKVIFEAISFEKELYSTFHQIVHYGKSDVSVIISIYKALRFAMRDSSTVNKKSIIEFSNYLYSHIDDSLKIGLDHKMILMEKEDVLKAQENVFKAQFEEK